jgi:hypothetical protein
MAERISRKSPLCKPKQGHGGDKTPVVPLAKADASIEFHPIADIFDLLEGEEFDELVKDISEHGLQLPIIKHEGKILEGRNRYRACLKSGVAPIFNTFSGTDPVAYVISMNVRRRHMTSRQKQDALAKLFKLKPKLSARQAAKMIGASPTTASETRNKLVKQGDVSKLDTSVDTRGRQQSRSKKKSAKKKSDSDWLTQAQKELGPEPDDWGDTIDDLAKGMAAQVVADALADAAVDRPPVLSDAGITAPGLLPPAPVTANRRAEHTIVDGQPAPSATERAVEHLVALVWCVDHEADQQKARELLRDHLDPEPIERLFGWLDALHPRVSA